MLLKRKKLSESKYVTRFTIQILACNISVAMITRLCATIDGLTRSLRIQCVADCHSLSLTLCHSLSLTLFHFPDNFMEKFGWRTQRTARSADDTMNAATSQWRVKRAMKKYVVAVFGKHQRLLRCDNAERISEMWWRQNWRE